MIVYTPDVWVIVKFSGKDIPDGELYKVLAGWYGGYAKADSWKLNSGITKIEKKNKCYSISGYSGSIYNCHKESERTSLLTFSIFNNFKESCKRKGSDVEMEIVDVKTILDKFVE